MKPLTLAVLISLLSTCIRVPFLDYDKMIYQDVYKLVKSSRTGLVKRKTICITNSAQRHGLEPYRFAKLGMAESSFHREMANWNNTCFGLYQIHTNHWSHLPYQVFNKKYAKYLHKHKGTNLIKVLEFIGVNTECGAIVLRDCLDRSDGNWEEALARYGGWHGKGCTEKRDNYIEKVLK